MARIDIIIPVYNAEKHIKKCILSLIQQDFKDWKAICIDDGSIDRSGKILDEMAGKDPRLMVIHTRNRGSIGARLEGLRRSTSPWVSFVDADDIVLSNMFSYLMSIVDRFDCDIACCGYRTMSAHGYYSKKKLKDSFLEKTDTGSHLAPEFHGGEIINAGLWGKLYRRKLFLDQLQELENLPTVFWGEDTMINSLIFEKADTVVLSDAALYCYRVGGGSSKCSEKRISELAFLYSWRKKYLNKYQNIRYEKNNIVQILNAAIFYSSQSDKVMSRKEICRILREPIDDMFLKTPGYKRREAFDLNVSMTDQDFFSLYKEKPMIKFKQLLLRIF